MTASSHAAQASWQIPMRATGNALIAPALGGAGAVALTSSMLGIGVALVATRARRDVSLLPQ
jgi:hypothetical protein